MDFLQDDDFDAQIKPELLSILKITTSSLSLAQSFAQEEITSYLSVRFDVASIFAATGAARNPLIIMRMIDLALYHLHSNVPGRAIPKLREDRYNAAIDWLTKVNSGALLPSLPELKTTTPDPLYKFGSNRKYAHRW